MDSQRCLGREAINFQIRKKKEKRENPEKIKRSSPRPTPFLTRSLRIQENKFEKQCATKMISYSPFMYLCLPNAELEQINEQEDVAVATLNAPSLAEICIAIGRR